MALIQSKKKPKRILIVDDEYYLAETIKLRLEFMGYEVFLSGSGAEALDLLQEQTVDLIVMDCMMPEMDGFEATRRIKSNLKWQSIPILFLTALGRPDDKVKALEAGAIDYIVKPFEGTELTARIEKALS